MVAKGGRIDFVFLGPPLPCRWIRYCGRVTALWRKSVGRNPAITIGPMIHIAGKKRLLLISACTCSIEEDKFFEHISFVNFKPLYLSVMHCNCLHLRSSDFNHDSSNLLDVTLLWSYRNNYCWTSKPSISQRNPTICCSSREPSDLLPFPLPIELFGNKCNNFMNTYMHHFWCPCTLEY